MQEHLDRLVAQVRHQQPATERNAAMNLNSLRRLAVLLACLLLNGTVLAATLTWTGGAPVPNNYWGTSSPIYDNWTAGSGNVAWTQGSDAIFDGEPPLVGGQTVRVIGGAVQFNTLTVQNIADGGMSIGKNSGNDADYLQAVGDATVNVPTGTSLSLPQVRGSVGLTLDGGGILSSSRGFVHSGGITILNGSFQALPNAGNGTVTLLDTAGAANARLFIRGVNSSWTLENDIVVRAGSSGTATVENLPTSTGNNYVTTMSGNIALGSNLRIVLPGNNSNLSMTLSGAISGAGALLLEGNGSSTQSFIISGDASAHTGGIVLTTNPTNKTLVLDGTFGSSNILVGNGVAVAGSGTLVFNIVGDNADLIDRGTGGSLDLTGLTLMPLLSGTQTQTEYVLADSTFGVVGPFANIVNYGFYTFGVEYAGTELNPGMVVLTVQIPEPATATMLALAGLATLKRRSRKA